MIGGKEGDKTDKEVLMEIQDGFKIKIGELPAQIDTSLYMWVDFIHKDSYQLILQRLLLDKCI